VRPVGYRVIRPPVKSDSLRCDTEAGTCASWHLYLDPCSRRARRSALEQSHRRAELLPESQTSERSARPPFASAGDSVPACLSLGERPDWAKEEGPGRRPDPFPLL